MSKKLVGACLFGQSGGPTAVINASAAGAFLEALKHEEITGIYGAEHGVRGILNDRLFDIRQEDLHELELLKNTPSSALGSVRHKLKPFNVDESEYIRILEVFQKYNIRYFFYNGGNDSMDTCNKISKYLQSQNYECRIIGIPKTIDNDLFGTDHCPGFGSAAKYVATSLMELYLDTHVYDTGIVLIVEVMGRNAGWLTAASTLGAPQGFGPDLIYLPEIPFDVDDFIEDVKNVAARKNNKVIAVISEGIKDQSGKYISEYLVSLKRDSFGHAQLGGTATVLAGIVADKFKIKVRPIEYSLLQRCSAHIASKTDIEEAFNVGAFAVKQAIQGETDKMVAIIRDYQADTYKVSYQLVDVAGSANLEKHVPIEWIKPDRSGMTQEFYDYVMPLIQGEANQPKENSLPRFAHLKKIYAKK
ncbi:MAG TPA: 6-phosphofructokinase [Bacilli bacterium]|nr:MAG: Pyrophosphate--fructose 6-phosphate 1-phosphotransferase [Tenericutes bacterium ADurb.BinA124]HNZ50715.1 6-phosphofructokinase [Bacilli bacterium]HPX84630.1 6-phosphofructokinase [Bacilli bacterium]HQC74291.1 6-phosphofructokinase [Bacilli bacterium]